MYHYGFQSGPSCGQEKHKCWKDGAYFSSAFIQNTAGWVIVVEQKAKGKAKWNTSLNNIIYLNFSTAERYKKNCSWGCAAVVKTALIRQLWASTVKHQTLTRGTKLDPALLREHKVSIAQSDEMKVIGFLHAFYPLADLALGINHQRPPPGITTNKHTRVICWSERSVCVKRVEDGGGTGIDAEQLRREHSC